jgi:hypothetical protein
MVAYYLPVDFVIVFYLVPRTKVFFKFTDPTLPPPSFKVKWFNDMGRANGQ